MRKSFLNRSLVSIAATLFVASTALAQPANDGCSGATPFGSLNTPGACIGGLQDGTTTTMSGQSTVGATGENPYSYLTSCSGGGNMTSPALDTWYSFVATGTTINITIAGFPNASVGVWEGPCSALLGRGCMNVNGSGNGSFSVTQAVIGTTYYIQISGGNATATDNNFSITLDNDIDCDDCLRSSTITSTPSPVNGTYTAGQVVTFCYTVTEWEQENTNWFHGVQITFGAGWTGAVTNTVPAATCDGSAGVWGYYPAGIAGGWGPGFYFDGDIFNVPNGDPSTNYGDNCVGTGLNWTFCFDLTATACVPGADLSVTINTTGDGESGSWTNNGCNDDAETVASAYMVCCDPPLTTTTPTTCQGDSDGALTVTGQGGQSPYDYVWEDAGGTILFTDNNNAGTSSLGGLAAGTYTITVTDNLGCIQIVDLIVVDGPPCAPCLITNFFANIGACLGDNTFVVSGNFEYNNNPGTGVITVTVTNGSGSYSQTFNPPFTNNTVFNYSIPNIPADGTPLTVTVVFSDDLACTSVINSNSPPDCSCAADIGTFSTSTTGTQVGDDFVLCWGQTVDITANGDWTPPDEAFAPPGPAYAPGIGYLVYSCPPTIALIPNAITDLTDDPCLEFIVLGPDLAEINDQFFLNQTILNGGSLPSNQTLYWVPVTLYSTTNAPIIYSYVNTSIPCYELGPIYSIQYLDDIVENSVEDCVAGTVTTTISGGLPALDGSLFTGQNLLPITASFAPGTALDGGDIVVTGLVDGDAYSYDIVDANGCLVTISGIFVGLEDPAFTYPSPAYCIDEANPMPTITGDVGGTFSSTAGLSLNAVTGLINLSASTPGTYTVTYTTPDPICFASATFDVTINPLPIVDGNDETICLGDQVTLNGTGANTYTWNLGVTNGVPFTPAATTTYTVTGTNTATGCVNTGTATVTVNPLDDASFTTADFCVGGGATIPVVTGLAGGTFAFNPAPGDGATINPATGAISAGVAGTTYSIEYTTNGPCPQSSIQTITVNPLPNVVANDVSVCIGGGVNITATGAVTYSWDNGLGVGQTHFVSPAVTTVYVVTGTDANGCVNTDAMTVTVMASAPIDAGPDVTICVGDNATLTATGGVSYTWQAPINANGATQVVSPALTTVYTVDGIDAAGCAGTDQVTVTVNPLPNVNAGVDQTVCEGLTVTLNGSGATSYVWDNGVTNGVAFNAPIGVTTTYTVTGTDANGCVNTDQVNVTVNPLPIIGAGPDQTVCEGVLVTLNGSGGSSYVWNNGVTNGVAFNPPVGVTTTYTVIGTDANGCTDTDQVNVTVNALPIVNAGPDQTVCDGIMVTLNGSGATSYTWNNGVVDGVAFSQPVSTVVYTVTGTTLGCSATDQVSVTVNPNPTPIINGAATYCAGNVSTLSTSIPFASYVWSTGDITPTTDVTSIDNPITVTVTNGFGCTGTSAIFTVTENSVITYNSTVEICQGQIAVIHGNNETVAGVYSQTFVLGTGCDSTSNVTLIVHTLPIVDAGVDQTVCDGVVTTLTAIGAPTLSWDNGITNGVGFTQPVGSVTYTVTGTDIFGCVNSDQATITVNPLPIANAGIDQTMCSGILTTLNGAGGSTYSWTGGVVDGVPFSAPIGTTTYTVTVTDGNGCVDTDQVDVTVNALPIVDAGPDQSMCEGLMVTLNGAGATTYVWDLGVIDGVAFNAPIGVTTTYTVTGTDANGCTNTDQVDVTVNSLPVVNAGPDQTVCEGLMVTLSGAGATTYAWTNGVIDGVAFNSPVGVTTTYTVTGTDINGCIDTDQVDVTVNALPVVDAGPDQVMCEGIQATLTASGASGYIWTGGVVDGVAFSAPIGATTTYTVTGTDANGCIGIDQVDVTVNPLPIVNAGNDFVVCEGSQAILTGSGALVYSWTGGVIDGQAFAPIATTTYTVTGTDVNGCIATDDVVVTVEPLPIVSFIGDNLSGCASDPLTVTFTNTTPGVMANCVWTFGNGTVLTGCNTVTTTFNTAGTYDVTLTTTSANGCTNSATYVDYIYVEADPIASFIPSQTIISNLNPEVYFENTSSGAVNYLWDFGDNSGSVTVVSPTHIFPEDESGSYLVELIAYSPLGCTDTAWATIQLNEEIIYYVPNSFTPDDDDYNPTFQPVFTAGFDPFDFTLLIFNRWGEIVFESHNAAIGWDGTYGGELVQDGTYTWKIEFKTTANDERKVIHGHVNILR